MTHNVKKKKANLILKFNTFFVGFLLREKIDPGERATRENEREREKGDVNSSFLLEKEREGSLI